MSIARKPDVNGNLTITSSCAKCAGGGNTPSDSADYGAADLTAKVEVVFFYNANRSDNGAFGFGQTSNVNLFLQVSGSTVTLTRGNGNEAKYQDDGTGNFVPQTVGLFNTLIRDSASGLWKESTPDGRVMAYPIASTGQISRIAWAQDAIGNRHAFSYDSNGLLQNVQDAFGRKTTFAYNTNNLLQSVTDFAGRVTSFAYDTTSVPGKPLLTQVTGPTGCQTRYEYDAQAHLTAVVDPNGFRTSYAYDVQNRVVQRTIAGVGSDSFSYLSDRTIWTDALGRNSTFLVDANGKLAGGVTAAGSQSNITRNAQGQIIQSQNPTGAKWQTAYDAQGNVISTTDPLGNVTRTDWDAFGNSTRVTYPDGAVEQMVWGMTGSSFDTTGAKRRLQQSVDPLGNTTTYGYNSHGQLTSTTDALGNVTTYDYDSVGNIIRTTDALGNVTQFAYDAAGNQTKETDALGATWNYSYDAADRLLNTTDSLGNVTQFAYDASGNQVAIVDALGNRTSTTYNAFDLPMRKTDALGNVTTHEYDVTGQATSTVDALGNRSSIQYTATGQVETTVDATGHQNSRTQYDSSGRPVTFFDALGNSTSFQYDAAGRRTSQTDAKGQTTSWTYDAMGRLVQSLFSDGSRTSYTYDAAGRQVAMQDGTGTTLTTYDALGRETSVRYGSGHTISYVLDKLGRRTQMTDPDGGVTNYSYDAGGRLTQLTNPQGELTRFAYDVLGRVAQKTLANGVVETHSFDSAGRETKVEHRSSSGSLLASFASVYDATGKPTSVTEADGSVMGYSYDVNGQLLKETRTGTNPYNIIYSYDSMGNRLTKLENGLLSTYSYNSDNQLLGEEVRDANSNLVSQNTATYDLNGNVTQKVEGNQATYFSWNSQNFLVGVTNPDGTGESYTYCGEGIRRTKTSSEGSRRFIRDGRNILLEVKDDGSTLNRYTHESNNWGTLLSLHQGQTSRFFGFDVIGNTRLLTDENGSVTDSYLYSAFGAERQAMGNFANPLRFGGKFGYYRDATTRLYVRARHLNVTSGQWISRDPLGFAGGDTNLFRYVLNRPTFFVDPSGYQSIIIQVDPYLPEQHKAMCKSHGGKWTSETNGLFGGNANNCWNACMTPNMWDASIILGIAGSIVGAIYGKGKPGSAVGGAAGLIPSGCCRLQCKTQGCYGGGKHIDERAPFIV